MKTVKLLLLISIVGLFTLSSCKYNAGDVMPGTSSAKIDSVSYALGIWFGGMVKGSDFGELNKCKIQAGVNDVVNGEELEITQEQVSQIIQAYVTERQKYVSEKALVEAKEFFEKNKAKEGIVETESGLQYKLIEEGVGISAELTDTVEVNYVGTLLDGTEFDSSEKNGGSIKFPLNGVIKGWGEGLKYVKEGGKIEIFVPADLGYGAQPYGPIPANSSLIFNVELVKVYKATPVEAKK